MRVITGRSLSAVISRCACGLRHSLQWRRDCLRKRIWCDGNCETKPDTGEQIFHEHIPLTEKTETRCPPFKSNHCRAFTR